MWETMAEGENTREFNLRVQKAEWIKEQVARQREAEDLKREALFEEQRILDERSQSIAQDMAHIKQLKRYHAECEEELNRQVYAMHNITTDQMEAAKQYKNAYYQGIALALFLISAAMVALCGSLYGFDVEITLFMLACTAIEGALLPQREKRGACLDFLCKILYLLIVPAMLILFVCYEMELEEYEMLLPVFVQASALILVLATCAWFFYNPYRCLTRKIKEAKSDLRELDQAAKKAVRRNRKIRSKEENRLIRRQQKLLKKEERKIRWKENWNKKKKGMISLFQRKKEETELPMISIAKRENNKNRSYLLVNRFQGKYIPAAPVKAHALCRRLAAQLPQKYKEEKLLVVGFAETATAIGAAVAVELGADYIQTTRESLNGVTFLEFTEAHSHATEQKIVKEDMDQAMKYVDRILFIDDELTTGKTIRNIVSLMRKEYGNEILFSAAVFVNGMDEASQQRFLEEKIELHYLMKTDQSGYTAIADAYQGDGQYREMDVNQPACEYRILSADKYMNARRLVNGTAYVKSCERLWQQVAAQISFTPGNCVLVLGTEEFMFPALYVAEQIEKSGCAVRFHATGRNPIAVSSEPEYPLHVRYELASFYDSGRKTFLYEIGTYDQVLILSDAPEIRAEGINSLVNALVSCQNKDITLIRWCV